MKTECHADWDHLKALALGLDLPCVAEATSWGKYCLKAHRKLWVWRAQAPKRFLKVYDAGIARPAVRIMA